MKKALASIALAILGIFSIAFTASACIFIFYQPELPQKPEN
jgi:cyclic lactone autoinducer peptide